MKQIMLILIAVAALIGGCCTGNGTSHKTQYKESRMFAHSVYFTLNDASDDKMSAMVADCRTYLKDHPGVVFFAAGRVSADHDRPVNVRDFDISLTVVFDTVASHDAYQVAPDHLTFIDRNKANWKQVRVFDSNCP